MIKLCIETLYLSPLCAFFFFYHAPVVVMEFYRDKLLFAGGFIKKQ